MWPERKTIINEFRLTINLRSTKEYNFPAIGNIEGGKKTISFLFIWLGRPGGIVNCSRPALDKSGSFNVGTAMGSQPTGLGELGEPVSDL